MKLGALDALGRYVKQIRDIRNSAPTNIEQALAPAFKTLVDDLLKLTPVGAGLVTVPEYAKPDIGRPDIALVRPGQLPRAFIELKAPDKHLDPRRWKDAHDKRQFERFGELPTWSLSNFASVRFFRRDEGGLEVRGRSRTGARPHDQRRQGECDHRRVRSRSIS